MRPFRCYFDLGKNLITLLTKITFRLEKLVINSCSILTETGGREPWRDILQIAAVTDNFGNNEYGKLDHYLRFVAIFSWDEG